MEKVVDGLKYVEGMLEVVVCISLSVELAQVLQERGYLGW